MATERPGGHPAAGDPASAALSFPDAPRLELDALLGQLVERAQEVMGTQGRLRTLLRANRVVGGDLDLPTLLAHAAAGARELIGARFAGLGVAGPSGGLVEFIQDGMDAATVARIGRLPQGKGLLGAVLDERAPIRLRHLSDDPRSAGLPTGHPPMDDSFLGAPIVIRGQLFGALYLVESTRAEQFTAEDEELLAAFAATIAVAVDNSRLYEAARARGEWLSASTTITRQLLSADPDGGPRPLHLIAERTRAIADADLVVVLRPDERTDPPTELVIDVAVGAGTDRLLGQALPVATTVSGRVFTAAEPVLLPHVTERTGLAALTAGDIELGPLLAVPLLGSAQVHGVLTAARRNGRAGFTAADVDMAASFANHAALAIELAEARAQQQLIALLDDRERIAGDLHDHVVQQLFGTGMSLQSVAASSREPATKTRLATAVADLDRVISQIRTTIFQLQSSGGSGGHGVRDRLLEVLADVRLLIGFEPTLTFSGVLEELPSEIVDDLLAVLREALTNVARHAAARTADVEVSAADGRLTLRVTDDGRGLSGTTRRSGLANMRRRATERGGNFEITTAEPTGTSVRWWVPAG